MSIVLKVAFHDDLRRITVPKEITLSELKHILSENITSTVNIILKYIDDEGDEISLGTDEELQEAIRQSFERKLAALKLNLTLAPAPNINHQACSEKSCSNSAPAPVSPPLIVHENVFCDVCEFPITGIRYKCSICRDFDLCEDCEATLTHPEDHPLLKIRVPLTPAFQSIHAVASGLHCARGEIVRVLNQPQISATAEQAKLQWNSVMNSLRENLEKNLSTNFQSLSEQLLSKAREIHQELLEKLAQEKEKVTELFEELTNPKENSSQSIQQRPSNPCFVQSIPNPAVSSAPPTVPHELLKQGMETLSDMGFADKVRNLQLLMKHSGDVEACLQELFD